LCDGAARELLPALKITSPLSKSWPLNLTVPETVASSVVVSSRTVPLPHPQAATITVVISNPATFDRVFIMFALVVVLLGEDVRNPGFLGLD
jgi:hypothetical protein